MHSHIFNILRAGLLLLLAVLSAAILYATNRNVQIVRTLAFQSLTDTALSLSSAAHDALSSSQSLSEIKHIFSDRVVAYALMAKEDGSIVFHTNPALINKVLASDEMRQWMNDGAFTSRRIVLGTGVPAYEFNFVMYRRGEPSKMLRLVLHTTAADNAVSQAQNMWWIAGFLILLLWAAAILFERFISHRIKTQAARERERRLTMIGQMTAVLAHEIRNALGSMKGYAQWLAEKAEAGSAQKDAMGFIVGGALRIESLVQELLSYSKEESYRIENIELAPLVREASQEAALGWRGVTDIQIDSGAAVAADREKLRRVIWNGVRNAVDMMSDGGRLKIACRKKGASVTIFMEDTGPGISEKYADHLFTPFYTTKANGTGLGLAYAKKAIEGMGGKITLANAPENAGAVLAIELPKARGR